MEVALGPREQDDRKASMCAWHLTRSPLFSSRHFRSASTSHAAALGCLVSSLPLPTAAEADAAAASMVGQWGSGLDAMGREVFFSSFFFFSSSGTVC